MSTWDKLTALKDYLGNIVDYNVDGLNTYCVDAANGDSFKIENVKGNVIGITTTCGELQMSYEEELTTQAPSATASLSVSAERRIYIPDRLPMFWRYIPKDVDTIWFYADRTGLFNAVILTVPDQFQDAE